MKYRTDVFSTDRANAANQGPSRPCRKTEVRYFTCTDRTMRSISSLLYDQKSCECSVKTQQGVIIIIILILL